MRQNTPVAGVFGLIRPNEVVLDGADGNRVFGKFLTESACLGVCLGMLDRDGVRPGAYNGAVLLMEDEQVVRVAARQVAHRKGDARHGRKLGAGKMS